MTLSEAFGLYRQDVIVFKNQSAKTEEHHYCTLKSLVNFVGDINIEELSFDQIRQWKLSLEKRGLSTKTIRGYLIKLRVVLGYLNIKGYSTLSPENIPLPRAIQSIPGVLSPEEVSRLISATNKVKNKAIISLLYSTGLRVNELCSLNIKDVEKDFFPVIGKGGRSRLCFIDKRSRTLLNEYLSLRKDNEKALFISEQTRDRISPATVQEVFKNARVRAGFDWPVHPHTMRHSFAQNLLVNGAHIYAIRDLMGHSSLDTTAAYLRLYDAELKRVHEQYHTT